MISDTGASSVPVIWSRVLSGPRSEETRVIPRVVTWHSSERRVAGRWGVGLVPLLVPGLAVLLVAIVIVRHAGERPSGSGGVEAAREDQTKVKRWRVGRSSGSCLTRAKAGSETDRVKRPKKRGTKEE